MIISYNTQKKLRLFNVAVMDIDKNGNYIYEYTIEKQSDIIKDIHVVSSNNNFRFVFIIGGEEYNNINIFISMAAMYHEFKIKFIFTEPTIDDTISICYKNYILNNTLRKRIMETHKIKTDTHVYCSGMCTKI